MAAFSSHDGGTVSFPQAARLGHSFGIDTAAPPAANINTFESGCHARNKDTRVDSRALLFMGEEIRLTYYEHNTPHIKTIQKSKGFKRLEAQNPRLSIWRDPGLAGGDVFVTLKHNR